MKALIKITANLEQINEAKKKKAEIEQKMFTCQDEVVKKNLEKTLPEIPEVQYKNTPLLFSPDDVEWAFINVEKKIAVSIRSEKFVIEYDSEVWNAIKASMQSRNKKRFIF